MQSPRSIIAAIAVIDRTPLYRHGSGALYYEPMRLLVAGLVLTLAVAVTASVFAIWPVVADAPWENEIATRQEQTSDLDGIRCEGALRLREAVVLSSQTTRGLIFFSQDAEAQLAKAEREIARYC
jgi:hypothetical protein